MFTNEEKTLIPYSTINSELIPFDVSDSLKYKEIIPGTILKLNHNGKLEFPNNAKKQSSVLVIYSGPGFGYFEGKHICYVGNPIIFINNCLIDISKEYDLSVGDHLGTTEEGRYYVILTENPYQYVSLFNSVAVVLGIHGKYVQVKMTLF